MSTVPERSLAISSSLGRCTFATSSASYALSTICAPAFSYASSVNDDAVPAPRSTTTVLPDFTRRPTVSGTRPTRRSSGMVSLGTPIFMDELTLSVFEQRRGKAGAPSKDRARSLTGDHAADACRRPQRIATGAAADDRARVPHEIRRVVAAERGRSRDGVEGTRRRAIERERKGLRGVADIDRAVQLAHLVLLVAG